MLIPPKPWVAPNIGGHISHQSMMMRVRGSAAQVNQLFAAHKDGKLEQVSQHARLVSMYALKCIF